MIQQLIQKKFCYLAPSRSALDLSDLNSVRNYFNRNNFSAVINCGAYTNVDGAESEQNLAYIVNGYAVGEIGRISAERQIPLIQISTDYVFDGTKVEGYVELDSPNPINAYGRSKLLGEKLVSANNPSAIFVRTSAVFDPNIGSNFYRSIQKLLLEKKVISVVSDQITRPTSCIYLSNKIVFFLERLLDGSDLPKILHVAEYPAMSWFSFSQIIANEVEIQRPACSVIPVSASEHRSKAMRPLHSVLLDSIFGGNSTA
mgnify:CR=1 FL=1